jgi:large subunit ribosomal protein L6e
VILSISTHSNATSVHPMLYPAGPYGVNGVPLRRVNQAYVIATSTKVDVSKVAVPATVNDATFAGDKKQKEKKSEEDFFALAKKGAETSDARKALQTQVDGAIKLSAEHSAYLKSRFTLTKGLKPHAIKF